LHVIACINLAAGPFSGRIPASPDPADRNHRTLPPELSELSKLSELPEPLEPAAELLTSADRRREAGHAPPRRFTLDT
jgi:hypothetical protein